MEETKEQAQGTRLTQALLSTCPWCDEQYQKQRIGETHGCAVEVAALSKAP